MAGPADTLPTADQHSQRLISDRYTLIRQLGRLPYVRIVLNNEFPRSHITTHLGSIRSALTPEPT